jgi:hypothetical protein
LIVSIIRFILIVIFFLSILWVCLLLLFLIVLVLLVFHRALVFFLNLSKDCRDLLVEKGLKAFLGLFVKVVHVTELASKVLGSVTLIDYDALRLLAIDTTEVDIYEQERHPFLLGRSFALLFFLITVFDGVWVSELTQLLMLSSFEVIFLISAFKLLRLDVMVIIRCLKVLWRLDFVACLISVSQAYSRIKMNNYLEHLGNPGTCGKR